MKNFLARHGSLVSSVLSGFDRLVFRGSLRALRHLGIYGFLNRSGVRMLDFGDFAQKTTERVRDAALKEADKHERPIRYLASPRTSKEDLARELLQTHPLKEPGLICAFKAVEPCMRFEYHRAADPKERGLKLRPGKCLHIYQYYLDPQFGFMHLRLQTYLPFDIQVCLNGREWLAQQMINRGVGFERAGNCFTRLDDPALAQQLLDEQLRTNWSATLDALRDRIHPLHTEIFAAWPMSHWWVGYQTEWATDLLFPDAASLGALYPGLVRHAVDHLKSPDVLKFLGRVERQAWTTDVVSSMRERYEGVRVKHWVNGNSVKMYDKAGQILRVETTIANPKDFCVKRPRSEDERGQRHDASTGAEIVWRNMRKSVADLHRRAELSQRSNERYLDALAVVDDTTPCSELFDSFARPVVYRDRRFRALRLSDPSELALLEAVSRGEFVTAGFRNRDLRGLLHGPARSKDDDRRRSARISRLLLLLRAHGVVIKIHKTHRYQLTERGRQLTAALCATRNANIHQLLRQAA